LAGAAGFLTVPQRSTHFAGLDSLRFWAAMLVVIGHVPMNQFAAGLPNPHWGAPFYRGAPAVKVFFALSGFLITYLLLEEIRRTGTVAVKKFYLRRVCRIWPLYFAVVSFGLLFYFVILPRTGLHRSTDETYSWQLAALLYSLLLPNLMNALVSVGGILNPLWSIGIEEQFYLAWAPAVRRYRQRLGTLFGCVLVGSFLLFLAQDLGAFGNRFGKKFVDQLEFHFMAAGALCALALHRDRARFLSLPPFSSPWIQALLALSLAEYVLIGRIPLGSVGDELFQLALYPWLIVNVAANPRNILRVGNRWTEKLGVVSYGIYMLHMPVVHATSYLFIKTSWWRGNLVAYVVAYWSIALLGTVTVALVSYRYFESPFLRLKERRFVPVPASEPA
jgi:peptidoglycan/LPS O-acetylase OafA/YrhL